ncbi:NAD(P)/FAD-dependent oxidoreductase [Dehalococcoides mccartyi]|uniref:dihydrolipoyl dehydrogenase family protein n=1 Tax=Dehalococcoides mccartyi TaxID=61435 RepID=UPI0003C83761|nr:NAD(P)/FAD-dependent oxidoreductase [Dehalococcoides mccartyi]AHB13401.1 FAD-containing flavoprotein [Dehalococcoides mccartyi GY50]
MKYQYDLVVIGGGLAGFTAAVFANGLGKKVALVERGKLGGACTWNACVPSKALLQIGLRIRQIEKYNRNGVKLASVNLQPGNIMSYLHSILGDIARIDDFDNLGNIGINILKGEAVFTDHHHINLNGQVISAKRFIIATGSSPAIPPVEGLVDIPFYTNETVFDINTIPSSMIVLGGGPAGIELGLAFAWLGCKVDIVEMADHILPKDDTELSELLFEYLNVEENLSIHISTKAIRFQKQNNGQVKLEMQTREGEIDEIAAEAVLVAVGRRANVSGLGLEKVGVKYTSRGISVDKKLQTSSSNIFAAGDVAGPIQLGMMAEKQAILAASNACLPFKQSIRYEDVAWVTYSEPQMAHIGLTEDEARRKYGNNVRIIRYPLNKVRRAVMDHDIRGMCKFMLDKKDRLIGAQLLCSHAENLIHELQIVKCLHKPFLKLHSIPHIYPTYEEGIIKRAADISYTMKMRRNPLIRLVLRYWPGYKDKLDAVINRL